MAEQFFISPAFKSSQMSADCLDCHTIARWIGLPVFLSHTTAVSRWFVMPIASICSGPMPAIDNDPAITASTETQISFATCSTQPGSGKYCLISC